MARWGAAATTQGLPTWPQVESVRGLSSLGISTPWVYGRPLVANTSPNSVASMKTLPESTMTSLVK